MPNHDTVKPTLSITGRKRSGSMTDDLNSPTTPRPNARFSDKAIKESTSEESASSTPTLRDVPLVKGQRRLPDEPFAPSKLAEAPIKPDSTLNREASTRSVDSVQSNDSHDVEMADDDEGQDDGSDNESVASDSQRPSKKKKKGQRFYCTDFPPCQLSFTRSEHLARHIRKHTGERPFQCHCSRRFSRLDNLRQHAQTVHVNEEIPGDSLAATGTRFQRQIRTDRVRPPNTRPRASTASSQAGAHSRGHSRNLSASSITSTTSSLAMFDDPRPRPAPLAISQQDGAARARMSLETFNPAIGNAGTQYGAFQQQQQQQPQSGYSTPTSSTFSAGASSPQFSSGMPSPSSTLSRSSFYNGSRAPRRLSVPGGSTLYQPSGAGSGYPPYFSPMSSASAFSNNNSIVASPTSSVFSHGRRDSDAELEWRRRTWHSGTNSNFAPRPATSGLSYHQTPDDAAPAMSSQPAATQITRLPGIESFDHAPPPAAPARRITSPSQGEQQGRPLSYTSTGDGYATGLSDDRRSSLAWEAGLQQNLTKLDIGNTPGQRSSWGEHSRSYSNVRPTTAPHSGQPQHHGHFVALQPLQPAAEIRHGMAEHSNNDVGDRATKRQAWYGGPIAPTQGSQPIVIGHRTSPESSSSDGVPTPSTSHGREIHPAIRHANGMIEIQPPGSALTEDQRLMMQAHYQQQNKPEPIRADSGFHSYTPAYGQMAPEYAMHIGHDVQMHHGYSPAASRPSHDMGRLEALVAVATSENRAVERRS